jgi:hypothetical protein
MNDPGMTEVVLLIACYNGRTCIGDCLRSLDEANPAGMLVRIIVADNASGDGSAEMVASEFPGVDLIRLPGNLGFTGGINAAWRFSREKYPSAPYVAVVNQDIIARPGWLDALVAHLEQNSAAAAAQPKVLLWPNKDQFNTAGNESHYLGFGLVTAYGQRDAGQFDAPREIDFPSGAAVLIRAEALEGRDLLDEEFFLYLEDAELGWRLRQLGYRIDYVPSSAVWHQYTFRQDYRFYFFLERNRWYLLAMYYKTPTLVLLLPAMIAMELGQFFFAWKNGVLRQKIKACAYFMFPPNLSALLKRRRLAQSRRRIRDREFVRHFVEEIDLPELRSTVLRRIGNPMLGFYWRMVRPLIFW